MSTEALRKMHHDRSLVVLLAMQGEQLIGGLNGEFGRVTNNPTMVQNQDDLKKWAMQWSSGPFGLGGPLAPALEGNAT